MALRNRNVFRNHRVVRDVIEDFITHGTHAYLAYRNDWRFASQQEVRWRLGFSGLGVYKMQPLNQLLRDRIMYLLFNLHS